MCSAKSEKAAAVPRHASTVVLSRDTDSGIEVYLLRRHANVGFMGGVHVFPGGKLMDEDHDGPTRTCLVSTAPGRAVDAWQDDLDSSLALGLAVAGIRETFEEAGVLLGVQLEGQNLEPMRRRLLAGGSFAELLHEARLTIDLGVLFPVSRWITPAMEPKRYDTRFYFAAQPEAQQASSDLQETTEGLWLTPEKALAQAKAGDIRMAPPTIRTLQEAQSHSSVEELCSASLKRDPPKVLPIIRKLDEAFEILYPGDPEHPDGQPAWEGPTRERFEAKRRHVGK